MPEYEEFYYAVNEGSNWNKALIDFNEKAILIEYLEEIRPPMKPPYIQIPPAVGLGNSLFVHAVRFASGESWDARNGWRDPNAS